MKNLSKGLQTDYVDETLPRVSIIIPFENRINKKSELDNILLSEVNKAETELLQNYPSERAVPVLNKLHRITDNFNYIGHNKSIAIFVSPVIEKTFYFTGTNLAEDRH